MFSFILRGGVVIDGTGNPWYKADVAVKDGVIAEVGRVTGAAEKIVDVQGCVVSPGFIDTHSHSDLFLLTKPYAEAKVMQGVTTEIVGQDGLGEAPITDASVADWRKYLSGLNGDPDVDWRWRSMGEYLDALGEARPSVNVASLVGHGNLRVCAMGMENRAPTSDELDEMKRLLELSLREGAVGLSTGLIYAPCIYSETTELVELCKVAAGRGGSFVVHMRNEGDQLLESIDEVVRIGRESGVHVHISHFKAMGAGNVGLSRLSLAKLEQARTSGVQVTFDQYPYTAGSTFLSSLLPAWVHEGGADKLLQRLRNPETRERVRAEASDLGTRTRGWDSLLVTSVETAGNKKYEGMTVKEIAAARGQSEPDALIEVVLEEENAATMVSFSMAEEDVRRIMAHPYGMVCTDGILLGKPHPRAYGAFPRILGRYVKQGVLRLEEAVRKMTSYPAQSFGFQNKGVVRPGFDADLTVFDPKTVIDVATYEDSMRHPEGVKHVFVNGVHTVRDGVHTGARAGRVLRRS